MLGTGWFASLVAQMVKHLPVMRETWVPSLGWEDPLEEGMATHSSILVRRMPMDRGAWRATVHGAAELDTTERLAPNLCGEKSTALVNAGISREALRLGRSCWGSGEEGLPAPSPAPCQLPLKRDPGVP